MGPLQDIMDVIHVRRKGKMMDTLEKFHIFWETKLNNQLMIDTIKPNIIFETIVHYDHSRGLPNSYTQDRHNQL
jgi:hypothetical protein